MLILASENLMLWLLSSQQISKKAKWHTQIRIIQGGCIYKDTYKVVGFV